MFFEKIPFTSYVLKGVSQIMLQENRWTGLLFLAGIFAGSWQCGLATILATAVGTLTAILLKFDHKRIAAGLYGFSPALVGAGIAFFFQTGLIIWVSIIAGSVLASILQNYFIKKDIPAYTFPFVVVAWLLIFLLDTSATPSDLFYLKTEGAYDQLYLGLRGFGQVIFQPKTLSGLLFFAGVLLHNPIAALYGLTASFLGAFIACLANLSPESITSGLFGFNAVLSAIAFADSQKRSAFWGLVAVLITMFLHIALVKSEWLNAFGGVLTFPFVAGVETTLLIQRLKKKTGVSINSA